MKNVWFIHCHGANGIRIYFHNLHGVFGFFPYVFDSPIAFLTVTIFFPFWEVVKKQKECFPAFFTKS